MEESTKRSEEAFLADSAEDAPTEVPRWDVFVTPDAAAWERGYYWSTPRKAGRVRLIVQTVLLAAVLLWSLWPLFIGEKPDMFLAAVSAAVCAAMWLVPPLKQKADARTMAASGRSFRLRVYDEGLIFGEEDGGTWLPFAEIRTVKEETVLILFYREEVLVIPRQALPEAGWRFLTEILPDREKEK